MKKDLLTLFAIILAPFVYAIASIYQMIKYKIQKRTKRELPSEFWIYRSDFTGELVVSCLPISFNDGTKIIHVREVKESK